jgi:hypothetical protein
MSLAKAFSMSRQMMWTAGRGSETHGVHRIPECAELRDRFDLAWREHALPHWDRHLKGGSMVNVRGGDRMTPVRTATPTAILGYSTKEVLRITNVAHLVIE